MRYLLAVFALAFAPFAQAQPETAYYGLQFGSFDYEEQSFPGFSGIQSDADSWRLLVGYQFMEHLAVEGGYGTTSAIRDTPLVGATRYDFATEFSILTIRLLGVMRFDSGLTLLGGVGYADMNQEFDIGFQGNNITSFDEDVGEPTYFAGVQYDWDRIALRLAYEKYDFGSGVDGKETSLSFFYKL